MKNKWELFSYLFFGALTTLVNFFSYIFFVEHFHLDYKFATSLSWVLSVVFAFYTNKKYVFKSLKNNLKTVKKELFLFFAIRLISYFIDILGMIICVAFLNINDLIAKVVVNIIIIVLNYAASKYVVFKTVTKEHFKSRE